MSWKIQITRAKPNPTGKDTTGGRPLAKQLLGEWVDLKNTGDQSVGLVTLHLAHVEFGDRCTPKEQAQLYWNGTGSVSLLPQQVVRVHTGRSADSIQMDPLDRAGVDHHAYAESGAFILNNDCGDTVSVWWKDREGKWHKEDAAGYDPDPKEGKILERVGDRLR